MVNAWLPGCQVRGRVLAALVFSLSGGDAVDMRTTNSGSVLCRLTLCSFGAGLRMACMTRSTSVPASASKKVVSAMCTDI